MKRSHYFVLVFVVVGCSSFENVGLMRGVSIHSLAGVEKEHDEPRLYGGVRQDFSIVINPWLLTEGSYIHAIEIPIAWLYALIDLPMAAAADTIFFPINLYQVNSKGQEE